MFCVVQTLQTVLKNSLTDTHHEIGQNGFIIGKYGMKWKFDFPLSGHFGVSNFK